MKKLSFADYQISKYARLRSPSDIDRIRLKTLSDLVDKKLPVLELGCYFPQFTRRLVRMGCQPTGLDLSPQIIRRYRRLGLPAYQCNLENERWPIPTASFDLIIAGDVIEHLLDTDFFLQQCRRVLRPAGCLILSTPNTASLGRRLTLLLGRNPYLEAHYHPLGAGHVRYFVKESLILLLHQHGFTVDRFTSDVILFNWHSLYSTRLARIWPTLGKSLIIKAHKV